MPPRRTSTRSRRTAPAKTTITPAITEVELAEAFDLFAVPRHTVPTLSFSDDEDDGLQGTAPRRRRADDEDEDPDEPVLKVADVRRALAAVDLPRPPPDFFDEGERCVGRQHFVMLGVTLAETAAHDPADGESDDDGDDGDDGAFVGDDADADDGIAEAEGGGGGFIVEDEDEDEDEDMAGGFERPKRAPATSTPKTSTAKGKGKGKAAAKPSAATATKRKRGRGVAIDEAQQKEEIDHAFALFTHGRSASQTDGLATITMADLRRVARELREDVDDQTLKAMMEEAGAAGGKGGKAMAVGREAFESVMKRAGVFG